MGRHLQPREPRGEPDVRAPAARAPSPADAVLALQANAGNQAVQRYLTHPTWTRGSFGRPVSKRAEWTENDLPPVGEYRVLDGDQWYRFAKSGKWTKVAAEARAAAVEPVAAVEEPGPLVVLPAETEEVKEPEAERTLTSEPIGTPLTLDLVVRRGYGVMDTDTLRGLRTLDKHFRELGSAALREFLKPSLPSRLGALSALSREMSFIEQYRAQITDRSNASLVAASDQVTPDTVTQLLGAFGGAVTVHRGAHRDQGGDGRIGNVDYSTAQGPNPDIEDSKMHNKAVVGLDAEGKGRSLVSGSSNLTYKGLNANTESAVSVRFPGIAEMYRQYIELIGKRSGADAGFTSALEGFNKTNPVGIRAALAPFVNVADTLNAELRGADEITLRMYLVGSVPTPNDPVDTLCGLALGGAKVSVVVDRSQAESTEYIRDALAKLQAAGVSVASETGKTEGSIMHDKLVFAHYPEDRATGKSERYTVMIGSSGLTKHVANNWNYENLLIIDDEALFRALMGHHALAEPFRSPGIPPEMRRGQMEVMAKLRAAVPTPTSYVRQADFKRLLRGQDENRALPYALTALGMVKLTDASNGSVWLGFPTT